MNEDLIGNYLGRYMTYANNGFAEKNFARLNAPNGWVRYPFKDSMTKTVSAFKAIDNVTKGEGPVYAWALILRAQSFMRLTTISALGTINFLKDFIVYLLNNLI